MKVLFLTSWYPSKESPIEGIFIKRHALALAQHCDVAVLSIRTDCDKNITDCANNHSIHEIIIRKKKVENALKIFPPHRYLKNFLNYFIGFREGYKLVHEKFGEPDLIAVNIIYPIGLFFLFSNFFHQKSYIIFEHHTEYLESSRIFENRNVLIKFFMRYLGYHAKKIIVVSESLKKAMIKNRFIDNFVNIPNVVEIPDSRHILSDHIEKHVLSLRNNNIKILFHVSSLKNDHKNITGILDAVGELGKSRNDFVLIIAGSGPEKENVENYADELRIKNKFAFFFGFINDATLRFLYSNCSFFVINSNYETFSVVTAEALLSGKPVVITRCGGPEEFVTEFCGKIVEPRNTKELTNAIEYMLDNYDSYDNEKIKKYAAEKFNSDIIGKNIYDVCSNAIK